MLKQYFFFIIDQPLYVQFGFIAFFVFALTMVIAMINILLFNYLVIPKIEKKVGAKLSFNFLWNNLPYGNCLFKHVEVMDYIILKYINTKIFKNEKYKINQDFSLEKIKYNIDAASFFEVFMSFFAAINYFLFFIAGIMVFIITKLYPK